MNPDVQMTLEEGVSEVLSILTGLDLNYDPVQDRFRTIVRSLNRAVRANALEHEWSYYSSVEDVGYAMRGEKDVPLRSNVRPRIINDDAVRLVNKKGSPMVWAYFLPRDALHKYIRRDGLWCAATRSVLTFSRPFFQREEGLMIQVPVMREPKLLELPPLPLDPMEPILPVPRPMLEQLIDFDNPDLIVYRAAYLAAQGDPVLQPRVQSLEEQYKELQYLLIERDDRNTDTPYQNEFILPVDHDIYGPTSLINHRHPHSDTGRYR